MADKRERLGRFYASRAASSLKRDQQMGYHWGYLQGEGKIFCTCEFTLDSNDNETLLPMAYPEIDLRVGPIVFVIGHLKLPSKEGRATALIVDARPINHGSDYEATAFCQGCSKVMQKTKLADVQRFVYEHEESCGVNKGLHE